MSILLKDLLKYPEIQARIENKLGQIGGTGLAKRRVLYFLMNNLIAQNGITEKARGI